ncbi:MAG TPA: hypothetical protein VJT75_08410 [Thermoleophilaceae bacterium]|nr:hypothetical protein [Thermoleophilaceae bacterium]
MLRRLRPRSAYDVMAALALFLVVAGGSAFAVVAANQVNSNSIVNGQVKNQDLATNSVGTGKIKPGNVKTSDLGANAVTSAKVGANALGGDDINEGTLTGVNASQLGGIPSTEFLHGVTSRTAETAKDSATTKDRFVQCPSGTKVVGGGAGVYQVDGSGTPVLSSAQDANLALSHSSPVITSTNQAWYARGVETDAVNANWFVYVEVVCAATG